MNPLIELKPTTAVFFTALLLACLAIAQSAQAITPVRASPNENAAQENNVTAEFSTEMEKKVQGRQGQQVNRWLIEFKFQTTCGCDVVDVEGKLHISFALRELLNVRLLYPVQYKVEGFKGTGKTTGRKYEFKQLKTVGNVVVRESNGTGHGDFKLVFEVAGNRNPPPKMDPCPRKTIRFDVIHILNYDYLNNKVKKLEGIRKIDCYAF
jgi:hypothetical protein